MLLAGGQDVAEPKPGRRQCGIDGERLVIGDKRFVMAFELGQHIGASKPGGRKIRRDFEHALVR